MGYQKLCVSNLQRDRFSVFLLYLDRRTFYLVKWNCNYSGKAYHPCPVAACKERLDGWQTMLNFLFKTESLFICQSLILVLVSHSGIPLTFCLLDYIYYLGIGDHIYGFITALVKCCFIKVESLCKNQLVIVIKTSWWDVYQTYWVIDFLLISQKRQESRQGDNETDFPW